MSSTNVQYKEPTRLVADKLGILRTIDNVSMLEDLAHEAFQNKGGELWREIQRLLFTINLRLMDSGFGLGKLRSESDWRIRNVIERVEQAYLPREDVPIELTNYDDFLTWLKGRIALHRVNSHALFDFFDRGDITAEECRYFLSNYRVNMQRFHLHVAAYSLIVPFQMRQELYDNLYDEFGQGNFAQAHPNLFEPLMKHYGGAKESDHNAETYHLLNTKISLCWFADGLHYGLGGLGALELSIPAQQKRVLAYLRRRGLSEELVKFFVVHCELDGEHGDGWFAAGKPYTHTRRHFQKVFDGAMRMLEARAGVYDGVLNGIIAQRATAAASGPASRPLAIAQAAQ
ncbi:iron-containing redox enzyme family protein [Pendulispora brunnea]|uniref:Iron-containing redox enzyme family protein n=1 Tax=Pendulispora brunnea TaxID=2905690 RepID=A0ABZ2KG99_9BACT